MIAILLIVRNKPGRPFDSVADDVSEKNPAETRDWTPLHSAARFCHIEVCGLIINNVSNKNPAADNGQTPHEHVRKTPLEVMVGHLYVQLLKMAMLKSANSSWP